MSEWLKEHAWKARHPVSVAFPITVRSQESNLPTATASIRVPHGPSADQRLKQTSFGLIFQRSLYDGCAAWQCDAVNALRQLRRDADLSQRAFAVCCTWSAASGDTSELVGARDNGTW